MSQNLRIHFKTRRKISLKDPSKFLKNVGVPTETVAFAVFSYRLKL
ncbi:hypothetical protein LEP1GSC103_0621 [Leptospira borgpetersenii serovar Javanica str. UI 09931]|uniref:Uncharacterized protein n=1 Tax=Leptospira borgpetersenii serovar Javanica str. UI 09931 TaxID=1049767 RepID=A0AAV3J5P3_LEPBO|nr:hypothetical protein LEP1GSC101_0482 [Leptospira borgpetersenii str. UI 09149]EMN59685.1 hypothetical protein LEP1GSC090_2761 [Leptospira borgpetersenii serovar Javanica str. MK146]EPG55953.1 hypothetical protein LEP1GSC103_0621 [Leptospira borgpetersenii serovar Javanica str. UI 09931]